MAELVDAADLKSADRKVVGVQVPLRALFEFKRNVGNTLVVSRFTGFPL